jgi:serine/threonine protein kinase
LGYLKLQQEVQVLEGLQHRNIVQYLGTQRQATKLFILLEYASGGSVCVHSPAELSLHSLHLHSLHLHHRPYLQVQQALKKFGSFSEAVIRNYTLQMVQGLAYLHSQVYIHSATSVFR